MSPFAVSRSRLLPTALTSTYAVKSEGKKMLPLPLALSVVKIFSSILAITLHLSHNYKYLRHGHVVNSLNLYCGDLLRDKHLQKKRNILVGFSQNRHSRNHGHFLAKFLVGRIMLTISIECCQRLSKNIWTASAKNLNLRK